MHSSFYLFFFEDEVRAFFDDVLPQVEDFQIRLCKCSFDLRFLKNPLKFLRNYGKKSKLGSLGYVLSESLKNQSNRAPAA